MEKIKNYLCGATGSVPKEEEEEKRLLLASSDQLSIRSSIQANPVPIKESSSLSDSICCSLPLAILFGIGFIGCVLGIALISMYTGIKVDIGWGVLFFSSALLMLGAAMIALECMPEKDSTNQK